MRFIFYFLVLSALCLKSTFVQAQTQSVQQVVEQQDEWESWVKTQTKVQISGRYDGRFSNQFRLLKLPISMLPGRTTVLPADVVRGQRITVSGILKKSRNRLEMTVERMAVGSTDSQRLQNGIRRLRKDQPEAGFELADQFAAIAEFYDDEDLMEEVAELRATTFSVLRSKLDANPERLLSLAAKGEQLGMPARETDAIRFESAVLKSKEKNVDTKAILVQIKKFEGWDKPNPFLLKEGEKRFLADMATEYEQANASLRLRMHRRFYRNIRLGQILQNSKADGSNGLEIAELLQDELPEAVDEISSARNRYLKFRISQIAQLTRPQLEDLERLLQESDRAAEVKASVDSWLMAQEKRLDNGQLDGTLATADQYFYAFDRWKHDEHRTKGVDFYKKAYLACQKSAPKEADQILAKLKLYGWMWLHNKWMTVEAANNLPRNDVEIAMLNREVVPGMKAAQVLETLAGPPTRKVRVVSAGGIHEIWIYDEAGATIVVHLLRSRFQKPGEAVVTKVGNAVM